MRLHLIRHGHYPLLDHALGGRDPHPLSDDGRAQAAAVAGSLMRSPPAALVTSPVRRASETAAIIGAQLGITPVTDSVFTEIDFAAWTNRRFEDLASDPAWHAWNRFRGSAGVPGGETMLAVQARAIAGVLRLADAYAGQDVAVVTHADIIKAIIGAVLGAPLDLMRRIEIAPCSITRIDWHAADAKLLGTAPAAAG